MEKKIINLKLYDDRIVKFIDMNIKIYDNSKYYGTDKNYRLATEKDYNDAITSEAKLYILLSQTNIQNPEILTETEKNIIKKMYEAFEAILDQDDNFDSTVVGINEILETVFGKKVSIW